MTDWDTRMMELARHIAGWSKDYSTKVGAVIADPQHRVVSMGYNGFPRGIEDKPFRLEERVIKYRYTVHAEANALLNAPVHALAGCTLYCTLCTCVECAKLAIQAGIARVVVPYMPEEARGRWMESWEQARGMYTEAGVSIKVLGDV